MVSQVDKRGFVALIFDNAEWISAKGDLNTARPHCDRGELVTAVSRFTPLWHFWSSLQCRTSFERSATFRVISNLCFALSSLRNLAPIARRVDWC